MNKFALFLRELVFKVKSDFIRLFVVWEEFLRELVRIGLPYFLVLVLVAYLFDVISVNRYLFLVIGSVAIYLLFSVAPPTKGRF